MQVWIETLIHGNSAFHATLTDQGLNIDPTDEDSWTFNTDADAPLTKYQLFNESGGNSGACDAACAVPADYDGDDTTADIQGILGDLFFEDGGILLIDTDAQGVNTPVLEFVDNDDQIFEVLGAGTEFTAPVTLVELGPNSGVFANYDELDQSKLSSYC